MAPTLGPVIDDCQRADEDPLSHGGQWGATKPRPFFEDELRLVSNNIIARNQGAGQAPSGRGSYWVAERQDGDDQIWGLVGLGNAGNSELGIGLLLHLQDPTTSGVDGYQAHSTNGINVVNFVLARITNDVPTTLDQTGNINDNINEPRVGDRLVLQRVGSDIEFWHERGAGNWILRCNATDTNYEGGHFGLMIGSDDLTYTQVGAAIQGELTQMWRYRSGPVSAVMQ